MERILEQQARESSCTVRNNNRKKNRRERKGRGRRKRGRGRRDKRKAINTQRDEEGANYERLFHVSNDNAFISIPTHSLATGTTTRVPSYQVATVNQENASLPRNNSMVVHLFTPFFLGPSSIPFQGDFVSSRFSIHWKCAY